MIIIMKKIHTDTTDGNTPKRKLCVDSNDANKHTNEK